MFNRGSWSGLAGIAELTENARGTHANVQMNPERGNTESLCFVSLLFIWHWSVWFNWKNEILFFIFPCCLGGVYGWGINLEAVSCIPASSNASSETLL